MGAGIGNPVLVRNGGAIVRLHDSYLASVCYLGYAPVGSDHEIEPVGTGFFVALEDASPVYLVTARHVAEEFKKDPFVIRLNDRKSGLARNEPIDVADWHFHPTDENIDVAILEYTPPAWANVRPVRSNSFLSDFKLKTKNTGPGDLAYVVGVFAPLHGKRRNIPAVHTGHVALMPPPDELIPVFDWRDPNRRQIIDTRGYLVEAQTLPGTSGGPVFVRRSLEEEVPEREPPRSWMYGTVWLLGLWQGAWYGNPSELLQLPQGEITVSAGIGVVVPMTKIIEALDQPALASRRDEKNMALKRKHAARPDKASPAKDENPQHREDFTALLGEAARKQQPDD